MTLNQINDPTRIGAQILEQAEKTIPYRHFEIAEKLVKSVSKSGSWDVRALFYKDGEFITSPFSEGGHGKKTKYEALLDTHELVGIYNRNVKLEQIIDDMRNELEE